MKPYPKSTGRNSERVCKECKKSFTPSHHGGTKEFCSHRCANIYSWRNRERKPKKIVAKICIQCNKEFIKNSKYSTSQWNKNKYCSVKCAAEVQKIKDGLSKGERSRRKRGMVKKGTEEWIEKIKATTRLGMLKPEVQDKLRQPRQPMSERAKILKSEALKGILPKNMMNNYGGCYANVQRGDYECSKGTVYFRSKWEANYALFLDFLIKQGEIKDWEFESEVFMFDEIKLGTRSYRPDFKVFNNDGTIEYHEVKGYMDSRSKTKLKRMAKYFPDVNLILIDSVYYKELCKKMKGIIKFY